MKNAENPERVPLAYLITFTCYGTHLPGSEKLSVDQLHREYGTPYVAPNRPYEDYAARLMKEPQFRLDENSRWEVLGAIVGHCKKKRWRPVAIHIRSTHCHSVIEAGNAPSKRMRDQFKAAASKRLNENVRRVTKRWTRGGSCECLWKPADVAAAVDYVLNRQGNPMSTYFDDEAYWRLMEG